MIEGDPEDALRAAMQADPPETLNDADRALARAWQIADEDMTDEVMDEYARLLPTLIAAGYAEADEDTWHFTRKGAARAEVVEPNR